MLGEDRNNASIDFILFDENDIIVNSKKLLSQIKETEDYNNIVDIDTKQATGDIYYKTFYKYNNLTTNIIP